MTRTDAPHWEKLWHDLSAQGDPQPAYREIIAVYGQPGRHYHNLQHVGECLLELDCARALSQTPAEIESALWFHDAVYDPHSSTNEEDSAKLAIQCLNAAGVDAARVEAIRQLILVTKNHEPTAVADAALLIDIDLAILGQPSPRFWEYEHAIRAEYAWVPDATFAPTRAGILTRFLERQALYRTERFRDRYEATARANLTAAIARLRLNLA
jgi:predicted metal-dependent HD superfamily phosphohydrolase